MINQEGLWHFLPVEMKIDQDMPREDDVSSWELVYTVVGSINGDRLGRSVSISEDGKTLAVGAAGHNADADRPGYVRVYYTEDDGPGSSWQRLGQDISGESLGDRFGISVSLSGDGKTLAVGAHGHNTDANRTCDVGVYRMEEGDEGSIWQQLGKDIGGEAANDYL